MKQIVVLLVVLGLGLVIFGGIGKAAEEFSALPSGLTYRFEQDRSGVQQVEVRNNSGDFRTYVAVAEQYRIFTDQEIAAGKRYASPEWMTVQPGVMSLPAGGRGYFNVTVAVPEGVADGEYQTYVKITDGVEKEYVTIKVLLGEGIGTHEYGITPGYYELLARGNGERKSKELALTVVNTGTADAKYEVYSRVPDSPGEIDAEYQVGDVAWVRVLDPKMELVAGNRGDARFQVVIPEDVADGKYKVWIGVRDTEQSGTVQVEYACKLLMTVESGGGWPWWAWVLVVLGVIGSVGGVVVLWRRRRSIAK
jgi:hypothetical protein